MKNSVANILKKMFLDIQKDNLESIKKMIKSKFLIYILTIICSISLKGQSVEFSLSDGNVIKYNLDKVSRITFNNDSLRIELKDLTHNSKRISEINYYLYKEKNVTSNLDKFEDNTWMLNLAPNPTNDKIMVSFYLPYTATLKFEVLDISGKVRISGSWENLIQGFRNATIDMANLPSGAYMITLHGKNEVVTKKIIKN